MNTVNKAVLSLVIGLLSTAALADTTSLPLTDDAFILGLRPTANYGEWDDIFVTSYGPKQGLVRFDGASIAGQDVNSATLKLYLNDIANAGTISVHAVTSSWSESTVTWNSQPPVETTATAVVTLATADEGTVIAIDVTNAVARWADGSLADAGFLIVTTDNIKAYFDAREKPSGIPATLEVDTGPPAYSGEAIVLDLSDPENCTIDEPGYYLLDRSWLLSSGGTGGAEPNANCSGALHISSGGVTLDLQGFEIWTGYEWGSYEPVVWIDTEGGITLRDGKLQGLNVAVEASVAGGTVYLERIQTGGGVLLNDQRVIVTGGKYWGYWEAPLQVGEDSSVVGAALECVEACLYAQGSSSIRGCTFSVGYGPAISVYGDRTVIEGNVFDSWVYIAGDHNVVARNLSSDGDSYIIIEVNGTANILEGNIGPGIVFDAAGNFYGNNRVALPGRITGADGNVDWGGNVIF